MVDEVQGGTGSESQAPVSDSSSNSSTVTPAAPTEIKTAPAEKMVPASQVSKIAAQQAREAADRTRKEVMAEYESRTPTQNQPANTPTSNMGGIQAPNEEQIRQMIQQEAWKMSNQALAERIAQDFESKMDAVKEKYPDFDEKYKALNLEKHPELVLWTREMDNVGDVVYDIANNPTKFAQVLMLANSGFPQLAQQELSKLSASIKANEAAKATPDAPAPLSQIKSSNIGVDNGDLGVSDYRKQPWLRG